MIARLAGRLVETGVDHLVVDVGGVGYLAQASARTLAAVGPIGEAALVYTEMQVREDAITLFGFATSGERDWFRLLTGVQGVGGRVALAILSVLEPDDLSRAVASSDHAMIARANGVGPKLASRIVNELKDKIGAVATGPVGGPQIRKPGATADALSALANLGFRTGEASAAVAAAVDELGEAASLDALVRLALKKAAR